MYLLRYMIVHNYQVVRTVSNTDGLQMYMQGAFKVPTYDEENFPFCITYSEYENINLVNIKECTIQRLVNCEATSAFCIPTRNGQFDLHFTSMREEEPENWFSSHHRMPFKSDLIDVMKRIGQVPSETLEDSIKLIEESKETKKELDKAQDTITNLMKENEELKSVSLDSKKVEFENEELRTELAQVKSLLAK